MPKILLIIGSASDVSKLKDCFEFLEKAKIEFEVSILSAHRVPDELALFVKSAEKKGFEAIIAAAGLAAHLPGVCASYTNLPVIGLPLTSGVSGGMDALLSIVQMPPGVVVATVGINNSKNAAILACKILAVKYPHLRRLLKKFSAENSKSILEKNLEIKRKGWKDFLKDEKK